PPPPSARSPLFPYTTLFRSHRVELTMVSAVLALLENSGRTDVGFSRFQPVVAALDQRRPNDAVLLRRRPGAQAGARTRRAAKLSDRKSTRLNSSHVKISYAV